MRISNGVKKGLTLLEVLLYIATLSIIVVTIFSFSLWAVRSNEKARAMREVTDNARRVMEILTQEIKEAKEIYLPTTTANQLSLKTAKHLPAGEKNSYIDFYLCGERVCFKKESQNPIALTPEKIKVDRLIFERVVTGEIPSIQIDLKVDYLAERPESSASINLKSSVSLRSYWLK